MGTFSMSSVKISSSSLRPKASVDLSKISTSSPTDLPSNSLVTWLNNNELSPWTYPNGSSTCSIISPLDWSIIL